MGKTPAAHADKITVRQAAPYHEIAPDSSDSERTISDSSVGIMYEGSQAQDGDLEGESAIVLPVVGERTTARSNSHGYTRSLEIDSASRTERDVVRSDFVLVAQRRDCIQIYPEWLEKIDSGKGMWTAFKQFRADGKHEEYYLHKEYSHKFCSKRHVIEFTGNGTVKGKPVQKRSADTSMDNLQAGKFAAKHLAILHLGNQLGEERKGAMGKTPAAPADKITVRQAAPYQEIAPDSSDSERTISDGSAGILYGGSQAQDGDLEGESVMVLPVVGKRTTVRSNSHGYTRSLEIDSASRTERVVARSDFVLVAQRQDCIQIYPEWLEKIDYGNGMWTAFKQFRADGKHEEYYLHKEYNHKFCSKRHVIEFTGNGTVKGKPVQKRSADTSMDNLQDYRRPPKRQRMKAQASSSSLSTGARTATTSTKLPHGFI